MPVGSGSSGSPSVLTVPGLGGSGPGHWQTLWEEARPDVSRVMLGLWDAPERDAWISRLDDAVGRARAPVVLVAHSLGCLAVAWWAGLLPPARVARVAGALLVAPPDVDAPGAPDAVRGFAPTPMRRLPFASVLVASRDDPWMPISRARDVAAAWGGRLVDAGPLGHLNAASGIGAWPGGEELLDAMLARAAAGGHDAGRAGSGR